MPCLTDKKKGGASDRLNHFLKSLGSKPDASHALSLSTSGLIWHPLGCLAESPIHRQRDLSECLVKWKMSQTWTPPACSDRPGQASGLEDSSQSLSHKPFGSLWDPSASLSPLLLPPPTGSGPSLSLLCTRSLHPLRPALCVKPPFCSTTAGRRGVEEATWPGSRLGSERPPPS